MTVLSSMTAVKARRTELLAGLVLSLWHMFRQSQVSHLTDRRADYC
ncbi:MAG: hypothetical protein AAF579_07230 [Cyanobacteria bacterium P01_C01_bin.118]